MVDHRRKQFLYGIEMFENRMYIS